MLKYIPFHSVKLIRNAYYDKSLISKTIALTQVKSQQSEVQLEFTRYFHSQFSHKNGRGATNHDAHVKSFRSVMSQVPSPVAVITAANQEGVKRGITCGSLASVSLHPPIISFGILKTSRMCQLIEETQKCAVHILSTTACNLAVLFSYNIEDLTKNLWDGINWKSSSTGVPLLSDAVSILECTISSKAEVGDHTVWFASVNAIQNNNENNETIFEANKIPLIYYQRHYHIPSNANMGPLVLESHIVSKWDAEAHKAKLKRLFNNFLKRSQGRSFLSNKSLNKEPLIPSTSPSNTTIEVVFETLLVSALQAAPLFRNSSVETAEKSEIESEHAFAKFIASHLYLVDPTTLYRYYSPKQLILSSKTPAVFVPPDLRSLPSLK